MTTATDGVWRLDPGRSSVEFHVRHFYGLMTVKGHFDRYDGTLQLSGRPACTRRHMRLRSLVER